MLGVAVKSVFKDDVVEDDEDFVDGEEERAEDGGNEGVANLGALSLLEAAEEPFVGGAQQEERQHGDDEQQRQ